GQKRAPHQAGAAELALVLDLVPLAGGDLRRQIAEQDRLGELLRADHDVGAVAAAGQRRCGGGRRPRGGDQGEGAPHATGLRWALRKRVTNGSAGALMRSSSVPCCRTRPSRMSTSTWPKCQASAMSWLTITTVLPSD